MKMNWKKVTSCQGVIGAVGLVIIAVLGAAVLTWLSTCLGVYLICGLMAWPWSWELGTATWIGLGMVSAAMSFQVNLRN